ncbi:cytochrome P450 87A3-like [Primulina tabacum]|uniref:cytochrome P450 87A3-like n=1 Tax=Primulina tabacum TaxID=48773 RepID=UPI003F5A91AE
MGIFLYETLALLIVAVTWWVFRWRNPKCNGVLPPGSMGFPVIGETLHYFSAQPLEGIPPFIAKRIARYGPIFRKSLVGLPVVMSTDPEINQYIFQQEGKIFQSWYTESALKITGGLLVHQGDAHRYLKNLARNILGPESLREELVHEIDLVTQKHLSLWHASNEVNVKEATEIMLFELAAKMLMGLDEAKASELRQNYKHFKESFVSFPLNIPGFGFHSVIQGKKRALEIIRETIVERRRSKENHQDFLSCILKEVEDGETILTEAMAENILFGLHFGAYETTSSTTTVALKFLRDHPQVLAQLKEEHDKILSIRDNKEATGITWAEYKSMTFTHMVINETVRLADNVFGMFRRVLQEVNLKGYTIPAGWVIVAIPSVTHLNPNEYQDPCSFNPSRWKGKEMHTASKNFLAFGGRRRMCSGADFAKLQLAIFIHYMVTR